MSNKIPTLYGYIACLFAIVSFLASVAFVIPKIESWGDLALYDELAYPTDTVYYPEDARIQNEIENLQRQQSDLQRARENVRFKIRVSQITAHGVTALLSLAVFLFHWRWLQKRSPEW